MHNLQVIQTQSSQAFRLKNYLSELQLSWEESQHMDIFVFFPQICAFYAGGGGEGSYLCFVFGSYSLPFWGTGKPAWEKKKPKTKLLWTRPNLGLPVYLSEIEPVVMVLIFVWEVKYTFPFPFPQLQLSLPFLGPTPTAPLIKTVISSFCCWVYF